MYPHYFVKIIFLKTSVVFLLTLVFACLSTQATCEVPLSVSIPTQVTVKNAALLTIGSDGKYHISGEQPVEVVYTEDELEIRY